MAGTPTFCWGAASKDDRRKQQALDLGKYLDYRRMETGGNEPTPKEEIEAYFKREAKNRIECRLPGMKGKFFTQRNCMDYRRGLRTHQGLLGDVEGIIIPCNECPNKARVGEPDVLFPLREKNERAGRATRRTTEKRGTMESVALGDYMTIGRAANLLGTHYKAVVRLIRMEKFKAVKMSLANGNHSKWYVEIASFNKYKGAKDGNNRL